MHQLLFFCSRTSHCCSNFFLRNSLAISLLLFDTPVRMIFARFFPKRMKDVRFAAVVPYNFSSFRGFGSYIKTRKKANWQRSSSIFTSQKGSHFIPYQRKCQIHKRERENTRNSMLATYKLQMKLSNPIPECVSWTEIEA